MTTKEDLRARLEAVRRRTLEERDRVHETSGAEKRVTTVIAIARALIEAANDFGEGNQIAGDVWQLADAAAKAASHDAPPLFDWNEHNHSETTPCVKLCPAFSESVPVPVLEALASALMSQAADRAYHVDAPSQVEAATLSRCAEMLMEAITHGGAG